MVTVMLHHETQSTWTLALPSSVLNPTSTFSGDIKQNSTALKMTQRSVSFLFMGDANADVELKNTNSGTSFPADIPQGRAPRQRYVIQLSYPIQT